MTEQEVFNKVATHLITQGRLSISSASECLYRGPEGTSCAVGCVIPDKDYREEMEGLNVEDLKEEGLLPNELLEHVDLLGQLQELHDGGYLYTRNLVSYWKRSLQILAKRRGLELPDGIK